jgi:hypothetical protein
MAASDGFREDRMPKIADDFEPSIEIERLASARTGHGAQ